MNEWRSKVFVDRQAIKVIEDFNKYKWNIGYDFGFETDYQCEWKPKKEKKMGKISKQEVLELLEEFASELGIDYSKYRQEVDGGQIDTKFLPKSDTADLKTELTKETKDKPLTESERLMEYYYGRSYLRHRYHNDKRPQEATILGKINAIAEHLGIEFEVQPERVVTTPVKVKAVKKATPKTKTTKVTAKIGKK